MPSAPPFRRSPSLSGESWPHDLGNGWLTFDSQGEIIALVGRNCSLAPHSTLFWPFSRTYTSFILEAAFCAFGTLREGDQS
jgi:hypothetical protein